MSVTQETRPAVTGNPDVNQDNLRTVYSELVKSYHAIDSFRGTLLGLLPVATGAGIFLLYNNGSPIATQAIGFLVPVGLFGFLITGGLFAFEMYGVKKCHALITTGQELEERLGFAGQFCRRPDGIGGIVNEPFASGIIYPAAGAAWLFVALTSVLPEPPWLAWLVSGMVLLAGFAASVAYNEHLRKQSEKCKFAAPSTNASANPAQPAPNRKNEGYSARSPGLGPPV